MDLTLNDTLVTAFTGTGLGIWTGDGGRDDGGLDAGGAAGDGEFVKVSARFPNASSTQGTLTWKILRSQYGQTGAEGSLTIQRETDANNGGYKVVNGRSTQSNFFVSKSGQISGTLPLPIGTGGAIKDTLFNGARFKDTTAASIADFAGVYVYGGLDKVTAGSALGEVSVVVGTFKINADGTGRGCPDTPTYSDTCQGGTVLTIAFDNPDSKNLLRIKSVASEPEKLDLLAVAKPYSGGISLTGDYVLEENGQTWTGAMYSSTVRTNHLDLASLTGAWSLTGTKIQTSTSTSPVSVKMAVGTGSNGAQSSFTAPGSGSCERNKLQLGPVQGTLASMEGTDPDPIGYSVMIDEDTFVYAEPYDPVRFSGGFALARRFSTDPTKTGGCQPQ